jgi:hypothetical protein
MKRSLTLLALGLVLASCSSAPVAKPKTETLEENLMNPLFAAQYWTELTERMVTLHLEENPALKDSRKAAIAERVRSEAVEKEKAATMIKNRNAYGQFVAIGEQTQGDTLIVGTTVFLGPLFETYPGVDVHLYLTKAVDPRDTDFPDASAIDLGTLQSPYGPQAYEVLKTPEELKGMRTLALWDAALGRFIAFAQLHTARIETTPPAPSSASQASSAL